MSAQTNGTGQSAIAQRRPTDVRQASSLARELAQARLELVQLYERADDLSRDEAVARARECDSRQYAQIVLQRPVPDTTWIDLDFVASADADLAADRWEAMVEEARDELATGHRSGQAVESPGSDAAWQRAQYLALADELADGWQPRNGLERTLVDMMAQALTLKLFWTKRLMAFDNTESSNQREEKLTLPRMTVSQAIDQAATMVERFDRMFNAALRQLRDLRRYSPTVIVQNAGQVNVG